MDENELQQLLINLVIVGPTQYQEFLEPLGVSAGTAPTDEHSLCQFLKQRYPLITLQRVLHAALIEVTEEFMVEIDILARWQGNTNAEVEGARIWGPELLSRLAALLTILMACLPDPSPTPGVQ